jgi:hypothetical protein
MDSRGTEGHQVKVNRTGMAAGGVEDGDRMKLDELPEQLINRYVIVLTVLDMTVRGLGILAFAWSTVVLLGGFVPFLERKDFWFITLISFTQSARFVTSTCFGFSRFSPWHRIYCCSYTSIFLSRRNYSYVVLSFYEL